MSETVILYRIQDDEGSGPCYSFDSTIRSVEFRNHFHGPGAYFARQGQDFPHGHKHAFETVEEIEQNLIIKHPTPVTVFEVPKDDCIFVPDYVPEWGTGFRQVLFPPHAAKVVDKFIIEPI